MSAYLISFKDGAKYMRPVLNEEAYRKLRNSKKQRDTVKIIREGDDKWKKALIQMNYSCLPNEDGSLKGATRMSTSIAMDVDHIPAEEMEAVKERILEKKEELGLLMLELSARAQGYHLVFKRKPELSQEENLKWASELLGVEFDKGAKDITRVFYTTTGSEEDLIYLDEALFESEECLVTPKAREIADRVRNEGSGSDDGQGHEDSQVRNEGSGSDDGQGHEDSQVRNEGSGSNDTLGVGPSTGSGTLDGGQGRNDGSGAKVEVQSVAADYNGVAFSDIINKYWELFNGGKMPTEGDRNALTFDLAVTLRSICGYSLEKMMQVIPNYWADAEGRCSAEDLTEWRATLDNALKQPRKGMPYRLKQVMAALKTTAAVKACGGTLTTPPEMPKKLPPLIKLLTKNVPWFYKPAVASAVFPALGAHIHGVKFRYWDIVDHEPTFMNVLIGRQSIGKGSIKKPIEYIMEDIRQRDIPNRQREAEWKQRNPGAKQKKDPRPTDICIQMLIDNLTDAVFNQRIVDANNNGQRFIYTIVDEIDGLKKVTSKGSVDEVGLLIRKAFDNSDAGQERVGADSVSGIAPLRWNFNASTTPPNARKFFSKMVNDGTVSRLDVATIIRGDDDDIIPILGIYDNPFAAELKPYIDRLEAANGLIECPQARKLSEEMREENKAMAQLYDSEAYRVFSYRANVIAWLKGMVLYVAQGYKWTKEIAEFVRWSQQYNLWCKMLYFGQQLERELREEVDIMRQSGPKNLLSLLPDEFSREEYGLMRQSQGKRGDGESTLRTWASRKYIVFDEVSGKFCKTEEFLNKFRVES